MWSIWGSRNSYNHGDVKYQPMRSMELVDEVIKTLEMPPPISPSQPKESQKCSRPAVGWLKLNCDGALNITESLAGVGVVVRDEMGVFVAAECRKYDHVVDPGTVELLACRDAMLLARSKGWTHIELETDCQAVVTAWKSEKAQKSACHQIIIKEMKATVSKFQGFSFAFVRRDANKAAHSCALV
uniref:Uncharacterized protein n=1 Tax=Avena sativa TaxID=4498 RepID=A0ACD5THT7_AVESA